MIKEKKIVCRPHGDGQLTMLLTDEEVAMLLKIEEAHPELGIIEHLEMLDQLKNDQKRD
ncbi:MAG: hypothetical protein IJV27_05705 [Prevotella sp.]|nr:hypothetical protein [Prevotella sp.]